MVQSIPTGSEIRGWCGNVTSAGFSTLADITQKPFKAARLLVSTSSATNAQGLLSVPVYTSAWTGGQLTTGALLSYVTISMNVALQLLSGTRYYYQWEYLEAASQAGKVRSFLSDAQAGALDYVFGSCADVYPSGSPTKLLDAPIYRSIAAESPEFFLSVGDTPYLGSLATFGADGSLFTQRDVFRRYRDCPSVDFLMSTTAMVQIISDHDIGSNDISLDTPNGSTIMANSRQVYTETTPLYPRPLPGLLTQRFDKRGGAVRHLLLDAYSASSYVAADALGATQLAWFTQELLNADTDGVKQLFMAQGRTWTGAVFNGFGDAFPAQRTQICDLIENCMVPMTLLVGDAHLGAADDGTNTAFTTSGHGFFPQIVSSGLLQIPSSLSGPYVWNGTPVKYFFGGSPSQQSIYCSVHVPADFKSWTATLKGSPLDASNNPTVLATVSTLDVSRAVSFNNTSPSVPANGVLTVDLDVTWFGAASIGWASSSGGQGGQIRLKPNSKRTSFSVNAPSSPGTFTITLSNPVDCTISGTNPITVTVT